ncbi:MAG TPA: HAMP domain-containing protein [Candidatus Bathyarchaeia archaeon]|nr:HAMP domain-containing protein [Candidatus Bathyarchaeia archaeon]HLC00052.1 HAMP domain-containing protein [Candidatus Bathyarchaeia archaeon]
MKIRRKLLLSYFLIVGLFIAAGATLTYNTVKMAELQTAVKQQVEINDNAYAYAQGLDQKQFGTLMYATDNTQEGERIIVASAETIAPAETYLQTALANDSALLAKFNEVVDMDRNTINPAIAQIATVYNSNENDTVKYVAIWEQLTIMMTAVSQADVKLADIRTATMGNVAVATVASQNYANFSTLLAIGFITAISVISVGLAVAMGNRITRPLKKLADIAHKVSLGDLKQRYYLKQNIDIKTGDEIDELVDAFKRMINAFRVTEALSMEVAETEEIVEQ